jgi:hypothetical protein
LRKKTTPFGKKGSGALCRSLGGEQRKHVKEKGENGGKMGDENGGGACIRANVRTCKFPDRMKQEALCSHQTKDVMISTK